MHKRVFTAALTLCLSVAASMTAWAQSGADTAAAASAPAATSPAPSGPVWVTLGTGGGPQIRRERSEPANALVIGNDIYLFDVGSGTERQMVGAHLALGNVKAIFISHHHIDHNADLGQLIASRWMFNGYAPLPVIGPPGTVEMTRSLIEADAPDELAPIGAGPKGKPSIGATVAPRDLDLTMDQPTEIYRDTNIRVLAVTNTHYHFEPGSAQAREARSYSLRIETPQRTFVYTGDTGPSQHVEQLAMGADVLISEVIDIDSIANTLRHAPASQLPPAMLPAMLKHMEEDHLTPVEIGKLAAKAAVKEVVLTHIVPGSDGERDLSGYTKGIAPTYGGPVYVSRDLDRF